MSIFSRVGLGAVNAATSLFGTPPSAASLTHWQRSGISTHRDWLNVLRGFYQQWALYDARGYTLYQEGIQSDALKNLRTAANRAVEFHVAVTLKGADPENIETEREEVRAAIAQVWSWSNWDRRIKAYVRQAATYGDAFIKVVQRPNNSTGEAQVIFQLIDPSHVIDFDTDERGFLTWIRIDIPIDRREPNGKTTPLTHTEVWERNVFDVDPEAPGAQRRVGRFRKWVHTKGDAPTEQLGDPTEPERPLADFGIDFIPIVRAPFKDVNEQWGMGCFSHAIEKIWEADRSCTNLHRLLYRSNRNTWAIQSPNSVTEGRASNIPPPRVQGLNGTTSDNAYVDVGGEMAARIPGGWELESMVPQLQYEAALSIMNAHVAEVTKDIPELLYYDAAELGANASGRARRIHQSPAIDRALEARANLEDALVQANQIALTLGKNAGIPTFQTIGTYEAGDFAHRFKERDVLPADELEDAQALKAKYEGLVVKTEWLKTATDFELEADGYTTEDILRIKREREAQARDALEAAEAAFDRAPRLPANAQDDTEDEGSDE